MREYAAFLDTKRVVVTDAGIDVPLSELSPMLYGFQRHIVQWALKRGRAAIFADCGLGKSIQQLEWARHVAAYTNMPVLILAPLAGGISETEVLNVRQARETDDERHLAPLQLGVIERAVKLWSAPGDLVLDPFNGIGSTGWVALKLGRRYAGIELKESYWRSSIANLQEAEREISQATLFDVSEPIEVPA